MSRDRVVRVLSRVVLESNGCWTFTGALDRQGYGKVSDGVLTSQVHRIVFQHFNGTIVAGLELDHLCRHRACCNPAHLEAVTHRENVLRGQSPTALNAMKTRCVNGHEFDAANTRLRSRGRECKRCHAEQERARYHRAKDQARNPA